jgi:hypothetical protein
VRSALAAALIVAAVSSAGAQSVRIGSRCLPIPEPDSMDVVLAGRVRGIDAAIAAPPEYAQLLADEIRRRIRLPQPLSFGTYAETRDRRRVFHGGWAAASFSLARNGSLAALIVDTTARLTPLDTAMIVAIHEAATDSAFPPLPRTVGSARTARAAPGIRVDTANFRLDLTLRDVVDEGFAVWGRARVPTFLLSNAPIPDKSNERPAARRYAANRDQSTSGGAFFVVDDSGRVARGSLRAIAGTSVFAVAEIARVAASWRFAPARIGECPVAVLTSWRFQDR